jgi:REP element-mobilizing transposase RayT
VENTGWHSRGYLPHIEAGHQPQFLTWRLNDSLPAELLERWKAELSRLPTSKAGQEMRSRIETSLDQGFGAQTLKNPVAAKIVQDALLFHHRTKYKLHAWVVMPTHVHALFTPHLETPLASIVRSIKTYTSREIHLVLGGQGRLWYRDYFDVLVRDPEHFERIRKYIEWNPVKAKLCSDPLHFPYCSANPVARERIADPVR